MRISHGALATAIGALGFQYTYLDLEAVGAEARDYSGTAFTLAGGLLWQFDESLGAAVHLTRSERHPQAAELYAYGPHLAVGRFEIGDDRLGSEAAAIIDVGLRAEGNLHWHVSVYCSDFADYIYADSTGEEEDGLPVFQYTQGDAEFYGLEAELEFPLYESAGRELHGRVGGDYVRGTNLLDEDLRRHASPLKEYVPLPGRSLMVGLRADF
jgi:iron complex outermembrane receptor protein